MKKCRVTGWIATRVALVCIASGLFIGGSASARDDSALFEQLRASELQLATIGWRLASANAVLCDRLEPGLGFQLHTLDQFSSEMRESARGHFAFATPLAIEGVVAGTPAAAAGLQADDSVVRIGSIDIAASKGKAGTTDRLVAVQNAIAAMPPSEAMTIEVIRKGVSISVAVRPVPVCRSRFELLTTEDFASSADGSMVQISAKLLDSYEGDRAAAAVAHELSHNILHHRDRLVARGVTFGMLSGFGGSVKYFRQSELQADILSVSLLANAGYPPRAAADFWRDFGPKHAGSIFNSRSHPHWRDRVATLDAEIARVEADTARPHIPSLIAARDQPLDGNWKALIVRPR